MRPAPLTSASRLATRSPYWCTTLQSRTWRLRRTLYALGACMLAGAAIMLATAANACPANPRTTLLTPSIAPTVNESPRLVSGIDTQYGAPIAHAAHAVDAAHFQTVAAAPTPNRRQRPNPHESNLTIADFSVVEVRTTAVPNARGSGTLGPRRQGGGIVIDDKGLVLTAAYLVTETEKIEIIGTNRQVIPATLIGHDPATGIGLVRAVVPLPVKPISFGDSDAADVNDPVLIVGFDGVAPAYIVARRQFAGTWEYLLEDALFTAPATTGWSGAALINREGKLLGMGMLLVPNALRETLPGNMFVPIDSVKPVITELQQHGKPAAQPRPWLGVSIEDLDGRLLITRVSDEGPAMKAGLAKGDIIVGLHGKPLENAADFYRKLWSSGDPGVEVEVDVVKGNTLETIAVTTMERGQYLRKPQGY